MSHPPYEITVDGFARDLFRVHSLTGTEALSEAYDFDIAATAEAGQDIEQRALGRRASLTFHTGPEPRAFYGVIAAVRLASVHPVDLWLDPDDAALGRGGGTSSSRGWDRRPTDAGEVEIFGDATEDVACCVGRLAFPFELCAHGFAVAHLAARVLETKNGRGSRRHRVGAASLTLTVAVRLLLRASSVRSPASEESKWRP